MHFFMTFGLAAETSYLLSYSSSSTISVETGDPFQIHHTGIKPRPTSFWTNHCVQLLCHLLSLIKLFHFISCVNHISVVILRSQWVHFAKNAFHISTRWSFHATTVRKCRCARIEVCLKDVWEYWLPRKWLVFVEALCMALQKLHKVAMFLIYCPGIAVSLRDMVVERIRMVEITFGHRRVKFLLLKWTADSCCQRSVNWRTIARNFSRNTAQWVG